MPTLADKINKNKSILKTGSGLFEQTGESIMSRIQKRGMPAGAGASPMAAAGLGVSPDQAKMAGTAAQMGSVIRESTATREGERRPQERMFETEEEKQAKQKAQKLSNLELLGSRIGGIVNTVVQGARPVDVTTLSYVQPDILKGDFRNLTDDQLSGVSASIAKITYDDEGNPIFPVGLLEEVNAQLPEDQRFTSNEELVKYTRQGTPSLKLNNTKIKETYPDITDEQLASLEAVLSSTGVLDGKDAASLDADDLNNIANIFGITGETLDTIIAKINEFIIPVTDTVIDDITGAVGPTVALADFTTEDWQAFGLEGPADLVNLLGITEAEASTLTVGELQKKVEALLEADYDRVDELTRVANDPFYPESLRKAAQAELRNLSSVGVVATESDFNKLNEAVQSADMIEVAGKTYTVDELLSDEQLTVLISSYLEDPESDYSKDLLKDFPALVAFINDNKAALENAMQYLDESIKDKIAISKENDKMNSYTPVDGMAVDLSDINEDLIEDYDSDALFRDEAITPNSSTHLENIYGTDSVFNDAQKGVYVSLLRQAKDGKYPELLKEFGSLTSRQIADNAKIYGISSEQWMQRRYQQYVNADIIDKALTEDATPEQAQQALTSLLGTTAEELDEFVTAYGVLVEYSFGTVSAEMTRLKNSVVLTKDGKIDYKATIEKFKDINADNNLLFKQTNLGDWAKNQTTSLTSKRYSDVFNALKDDVLTIEEVNKILELPDNVQVSKLIEIVYDKTTPQSGMISSMGANPLFQAVDKFVNDKYKNHLNTVFEKPEEVTWLLDTFGADKPIAATNYNYKMLKAYDRALVKAIGDAEASGVPQYVINRLKKTSAQVKTNMNKIKSDVEKSNTINWTQRIDDAWDDYEAGQRGGVD